MISTGLAMLGASLLGAGASIYGANKASSAQEAAANKAAAIQQQAMEYQKQNYETASGNLSPFIKTGTGATNLLASFYGLNGSDPALGQSALERFRQSPDYQFAKTEGINALDNSAAAKGGVLGGNQMRAVTEYGSGLATQNLQNYLTRLTGLSGQGIQAGGYLGQIGTGAGSQVGTSANNIANSTMAAGTAEASGILGTVKGIDSGLNSLSLYNQLGKSSYSGYLPGGGTGFSLNNTGGLY
jgi:hypothetical protein